MVSGNPPSAVQQQAGVTYEATGKLLANGVQILEQTSSPFSATSKCSPAQWSTASTTHTVKLSVRRIESGESTELIPLSEYGVTVSGMTASIDVPQQGQSLNGTPFYANLNACNNAGSIDPAVLFNVESS